jgi:PPP family 3-phenylpropionic acid transporter
LTAAARLGGFYAAYFGTVGVWMPFWPAWLESRQLDASQIGLVLAVGFWIRLLTNPVVAWLSDVRGERRRPMVLLALIATIAYAAFALARDPWHFVLLSAVTGATYTVLVPFADSVTLAHVRSGHAEYGRVRLWGSLAFIVCSVGAGELLSEGSGDLTLWLVVAGVFATFVSCVIVPAAPAAASRVAASLGDLRALVTRPRFLILVLGGALVQGSHAVYYGFATIHWRAAGLDSLVIGLLWAEGVIAEILLFYAGQKLSERFRPSTLLALGGAGGVVRWIVLASTTHPALLACVQVFHAFTFAATHLSAVTAIGRWVPEQLSATALTTYSTVVGGVALGSAMIVAGTLYEAHHGTAFLFAAALAAAGLLAAMALRSIADPASSTSS